MTNRKKLFIGAALLGAIGVSSVAAPTLAAEFGPPGGPRHQDGFGGPRGFGPGGEMMERLCASDVGYMVGKIGDHIGGQLRLTDAEQPSFKDLRDTAVKALTSAKAACGQKPDFATVTGRLDFAVVRGEALLTAVKTIQPKLDAFYASLDDGQKKLLDAFGHHPRRDEMDPNEQDGAQQGPGNGWRPDNG
jgi:hypothetical protein